MGHDAAYKDDSFSAEEAGQLLLQKMVGTPVDPHECYEALVEADAKEHEQELQAPDDDND